MRITHNQVQKYCKEICSNIKKSGETFDQIVVITKGGMIPGYYFAKELGIKRIIALNFSSYRNGKQGGVQNWTDELIYIDEMDNTLIVDDLVDSGNTLDYVLFKYFGNEQEYKIATLFHKKGSIVEPNWCYSYNEPKDKWIEFEYEL